MANDKENNEVILDEEVKNETSTKGKKSNSKKNLAADKADEYIARLNNDLLEQKKLADEYYDSLKRNMADFDNYKKRIIKEKESTQQILSCVLLCWDKLFRLFERI